MLYIEVVFIQSVLYMEVYYSQRQNIHYVTACYFSISVSGYILLSFIVQSFGGHGQHCRVFMDILIQ